MDIRTFFHPRPRYITFDVNKMILATLRHGRFHDVKFKKYQRRRFIREVAEEFLPIFDEMKKAGDDTEQEVEEVFRCLVKDWIQENIDV